MGRARFVPSLGEHGQGALEVSLYVNDAFLARHNNPARARLRGLARNPAICGALLRRLVDEYFQEIGFDLEYRRHWSDEQFDALMGHPDPEVRIRLAKALHVTPEQVARLVEDSSLKVLKTLASGPTPFDLPIAVREARMPLWAYKRLIDRDPGLREAVARSRWAPTDLRQPLPPSTTARVDEPLGDPRQAEDVIRRGDDWIRARVATDHRLPADLVARLAVDPSPMVRLAESMRLCSTCLVMRNRPSNPRVQLR
jgi:hypothetical protein